MIKESYTNDLATKPSLIRLKVTALNLELLRETGELIPEQKYEVENEDGTISIYQAETNNSFYERDGSVASVNGKEGIVILDAEDVGALSSQPKEYNPAEFSGLGKVYLEQNIIDGENILTQDMIAEDNTVYVIRYDYDLNGETLTMLRDNVLLFEGGSLSNGELEIRGSHNIQGTYGALNYDLILKPVYGFNEGTEIEFDYYKVTKTYGEYTQFINGNNETYGELIPQTSYNTVILQNLVADGFPVKFGDGVYLFNEELLITKAFKFRGNGRDNTLLWAPTTGFITYRGGTGNHCYMNDLSVESWGSVWYIAQWLSTSFHAPTFRDANFISYNSHVFWQDNSTEGGGGGAYDVYMERCEICAPNNSYGIYNFGSASCRYNDVVDAAWFFSKNGTGVKGKMHSILYNSNGIYENANVTYHGARFLWTINQVKSSLWTLKILNNTFEAINSLEYIINIESASNLHITYNDNRHISLSSDRIINNLGANTYLYGTGGITLIPHTLETAGTLVSNQTPLTVYTMSRLVHSGGTRRDLIIFEPWSLSSTSIQRAVVYGQDNFSRETIIDDYGYPEALMPTDFNEVYSIMIKPSSSLCKVPYTSYHEDNKRSLFRKQPNQLCYWNGLRYANIDGTKTTKLRVIDELSIFEKVNTTQKVTDCVQKIVDDIDLGGKTIKIYENCTLRFDGGTINNGTLDISSGGIKIENFAGTAVLNGNPRGYGDTTQRPTQYLIKGQQYFDTTLNRLIIWNGLDWVDAISYATSTEKGTIRIESKDIDGVKQLHIYTND